MDSYYSKVLYPFVKNLILYNFKSTRDGYQLHVDDLDEHDQYMFAMHLIEESDRDLSSIYENEKYDDIVCSLFQLLKKDDTDHKLDFAETVRDKIVSYYKPKMQTMIDDIIGWVEKEDYEEREFVHRQHRDNGEYYWSAP